MHQTNLLPLAALAHLITAAPAPTGPLTKPPAFILAGDSTTAVQSTGGGGWGTGFLNNTVQAGAAGTNFGHDGATTVSFRAGGDWANVLAATTNYSANYTPFVTIQFGHNDQKPSANITLPEFTANLAQFATDVDALGVGATPVIVTPLSRRTFDDAVPPAVVEDLANMTGAAIQAAEAGGWHWINLNRESTEFLNDVGPANASVYNLISTDFTHLNPGGSVVFGGLVGDLLVAELPWVWQYVGPGLELEEALKTGLFYWPAGY